MSKQIIASILIVLLLHTQCEAYNVRGYRINKEKIFVDHCIQYLGRLPWSMYVELDVLRIQVHETYGFCFTEMKSIRLLDKSKKMRVENVETELGTYYIVKRW
jgi:hypothetical protein